VSTQDKIVQSEPTLSDIVVATKRVGQTMLAVGSNRLELLLVEIQEERERLFLALFLTFGCVVLGLLAGVAVTFAVAMLFRDHSPVIALLGLAVFYLALGVFLFARLKKLQREWTLLGATRDQVKKDRDSLERLLQ